MDWELGEVSLIETSNRNYIRSNKSYSTKTFICLESDKKVNAASG